MTCSNSVTFLNACTFLELQTPGQKLTSHHSAFLLKKHLASIRCLKLPIGEVICFITIDVEALVNMYQAPLGKFERKKKEKGTGEGQLILTGLWEDGNQFLSGAIYCVSFGRHCV